MYVFYKTELLCINKSNINEIKPNYVYSEYTFMTVLKHLSTLL